MATTETITRVKPDQICSVPASYAEVGARARERLGYTWADQRAGQASDEARLAETLLGLEIDILEPTSVEEYQKSKLSGSKEFDELASRFNKAEKKMEIASDRITFFTDPEAYILLGLITLAIVGLGAILGQVGVWIWNFSFQSAVYATAGSLLGVGVVVASVLLGSAVIWWLRGPSIRRSFDRKAGAINERGIYHWNSCTVDRFNLEIPERELEKMLRIKEQLPAARFNVHYTVHSPRQLHYDQTIWSGKLSDAVRPDPLLEVELGTAKFFVGVWDEPDYRYTAVQDQLIEN